jgi:hypothetical protein
MFAIDTAEAAQARADRLAREFPNGPPGLRSDRTFSRFAVERYAMGERPALWGIVVRWRYRPTAERPDLDRLEMGGAFVRFGPGGVVTEWNCN